MGSGDNFTTNISEWLQIGNVKGPDQSTNKVNYIRQMRKHDDLCTGLDSTEDRLLYLALHGSYDGDSAKVVNVLSAIDT